MSQLQSQIQAEARASASAYFDTHGGVGIRPRPGWRCGLSIIDDTLRANLVSSDANSEGPSATETLGTLETLPFDLLYEIAGHLDLYSLMCLRLTNRRMKAFIEALPAFKAVMTHAPHIINALMIEGAARAIPCDALRRKLRSGDCEKCAHFAAFIHLHTAQRLCYDCIREKGFAYPSLRTLKTLPESELAKKCNMLCYTCGPIISPGILQS